MKFAYFGTDYFATIILEELQKSGFVADIIVTTSDKPKGRKLLLTPPPAKVWAQNNNIKFIQPEKLSPESFSGTTWDMFIVASYGLIIPKEIINLPKHKTLNVHPSMLPKLRGASPVETAILEENETGVTIMRVDEKMDHGPIIAQREILSWTTETAPSAPELGELLARSGGSLLAESIPHWISGNISEQEQEHGFATYTKKITKEDGLINLEDSPEKNYRKIQAYKEWPRSYFFIKHNQKEKRVIITDAEFIKGKLKIIKVIPEGGKEMSFADFKKGYGSTLPDDN